MSTSDSLLVFIKSSLDLNFALLLSSDDDVASLKKKAEAQHLELFPHKGKIVAQYIKIMLEGKTYPLSDSLPVSCLFDGAKGTLYMDAMTVPPSPPKTHATVLDPRENSLCKRRILSQGDPSSGGDPIEGLLNQHNNTSCTSESFKRKSLEGSANMDSVLGEVNQGADVLGELAENKGKQKISKDPFFYEVPPSNERESPKRGDRMRESSVASENETAGEHLEGPTSLADNPGDPFSGGDPIAGLLNQGTNTSCTTESFKSRSLEGSVSMDSVLGKVNQGADVLGELAEHKGKQKISKEPFFDEVLPSNERQSPKRGDKMRESCVASENETAGEHWEGHSSLADNPELPREGMLTYRARSLEHLTKQLPCTASDKGKAKLHLSVSSSSGSGPPSPNYKRLETHKTQHHGVTIHEPCAASREVSRVESSGEEERERGPSYEKYWSIEGSGSQSEDQLARINQIECDEILARSLQEMDRSVEHFSYQRSAIQIPIRKTEMRFSGPEMEHEMLLLSQLRQEFSSSQADHDKKLELLKELEAIYESRVEMDISCGFDFYQDLFYDEDENVAMTDKAMGATESQINNLPVSTIKEHEGKDACIICLETPSIGSVMRHLPCLHKFHKECVDKWLPIRGSCPVCKLAID